MAIIKYACLQLKERDLKISLKSKAKSKGNGKQNALISYAISNVMLNVRYTDTRQSLSQTLRVNTHMFADANVLQVTTVLTPSRKIDFTTWTTHSKPLVFFYIKCITQ